jgi:hypothetical protein
MEVGIVERIGRRRRLAGEPSAAGKRKGDRCCRQQ